MMVSLLQRVTLQKRQSNQSAFAPVSVRPSLRSSVPRSGPAPRARRDGPSLAQHGSPGIHAGRPTPQNLPSASREGWQIKIKNRRGGRPAGLFCRPYVHVSKTCIDQRPLRPVRLLAGKSDGCTCAPVPATNGQDQGAPNTIGPRACSLRSRPRAWQRPTSQIAATGTESRFLVWGALGLLMGEAVGYCVIGNA